MYEIKFLDGTVKIFESLEGANLEGANLKWANLEGANLEGATLFDTPVITFQYSKYFAFYHEGNVKIGCLTNTLSYWLENYEVIGEEQSFTPKETMAYGLWLKVLKQLEEIPNE